MSCSLSDSKPPRIEGDTFAEVTIYKEKPLVFGDSDFFSFRGYAALQAFSDQVQTGDFAIIHLFDDEQKDGYYLPAFVFVISDNCPEDFIDQYLKGI